MARSKSKKSSKEKNTDQSEGRLPKSAAQPGKSGVGPALLGLQPSAGNQALTEWVEAAKEKGLPSSVTASPGTQEVLRSPGQPLDPATREAMEARFGHDFGRVRVHTGERAAESAQSVDARAYTVGQEVVFDAGRYAPGTGLGQQLLSHELAHVAQRAAQPSLAGQVCRDEDKDAKQKSALLKQAGISLDKGLKALASGKPKQVGLGSAQIKKGIGGLQTAAKYAKEPEKSKILRVAGGLAALVAVASASLKRKAGQKALRSTFTGTKAKTKEVPVAGSEEISKSEFAKATAIYKELPQDFSDLFPELSWTDHGLLVTIFTTTMEQRLTVMESMKKAGAPPKSYPPSPAEVEDYFTNLGVSGAKNDEICQAYEDYAKIFFEHGAAQFDPKKMGTAKVYAGKQSIIGTIFTDCDGYARLGIRLLTLAGFTLEKVIVGIRNVKTVAKGVKTYSDVHAVGQLTRGGETVFVSNAWIYGSEGSAFDVAWDHPDAPLIKGEGKTLAEANKDALAKMKED
jgi:hypothetical protein